MWDNIVKHFIFYLDGCEKEYSCTVIQCKHVIYSALHFTISYFVHRTYETFINIYMYKEI